MGSNHLTPDQNHAIMDPHSNKESKMTRQEIIEKGKNGVNKVSVGVSVRPEVKAFLVALSEESGMNISKIVESLIEELVAKSEEA